MEDQFDFDDLGDSPPPLEWPIPFEQPIRPATPLPMEDISPEATPKFWRGFDYTSGDVVRPTPRRARSTERHAANKELKKKVRASLTPSRSWSRRRTEPERPKSDTKSSDKAAGLSANTKGVDNMNLDSVELDFNMLTGDDAAESVMDSDMCFPSSSTQENDLAQNSHLVASVMDGNAPMYNAVGAGNDNQDVSGVLADLTRRLLAEWQAPPPNHSLFVPYTNRVESQCMSTQTMSVKTCDKAVQATSNCDCGSSIRRAAWLICATCDGRVLPDTPPARTGVPRALNVSVVETGEHLGSQAEPRGFLVVPAPVIGSPEWLRLIQGPPAPPPAHQPRRSSLGDIAQCVARERTIQRFEEAMKAGQGGSNHSADMALDLSRPNQ